MILERIRAALPEMTPIQKKIAHHILDHGQSVGLSSIYAVSEIIGVSNASLIRFARGIGLEGYSDLKRELQAEIRRKLSPYDKIGLSELNTLPRETRLRKMFRNELNNLRVTLDGLNPEVLERIAAGICAARRVFVSGFGVSRQLARIFEYSLLSTLSKDVVVISGSVSDYSPHLKSFGASDIAILMTFPPYSAEGGHVASIAKERGGRLYLFTDSASCPSYPLANAVVTCENNSLLMTNSFVGLVAVLQILVNMICLEDKDTSIKERSVVRELESQGYGFLGRGEDGA